MEKKTFDWEYCKKIYSLARYSFLRKNFDKPITEEEYVARIKTLKKDGQLKGKNKRGYNPCHLKKQYQNLKDSFGFFNPQP